MKKIAILMDGSNFYFKLKDLKLSDQLKFDFASFSKYLSGTNTPVICKYYIGAIKTDGTAKMKRLHGNQQKLFSHIKKNGFSYELGYLLKTKDKYHEKGVDVHMAVDLLKIAYENLADEIILISSDTDLIPAIKQAQLLKKKIKFIGFEHKISNALKAQCDKTILLNRNQLEKF